MTPKLQLNSITFFPENLSNPAHFHIAIKLNRQRRWLRVRNSITRDHGINVNFSDNHANYFDTWEYTTKSDTEFLQSPNHSDFSAEFVPKTGTAMNAQHPHPQRLERGLLV